MITDKQILSFLKKWKKKNRLKTIDMQEKLAMCKATYHRRINTGKWTRAEVDMMKELGIITE
jgi:hypothetical protein